MVVEVEGTVSIGVVAFAVAVVCIDVTLVVTFPEFVFIVVVLRGVVVVVVVAGADVVDAFVVGFIVDRVDAVVNDGVVDVPFTIINRGAED